MATLIVVLETKGDSAAADKAVALSPLTGEIVSLGMYDIERELGAVYYTSGDDERDFSDESFSYKIRGERELLEDWWEGARSYDTFVTFNGHSFTMPFLYHRSAIHKLRSTTEIARQRYLTKQTLPYHIDLLDELSFYHMMQPCPSLKVLCDAYGIEHEAMGESERAEIFLKENFRPLALHNAGKLQALRQLYKIWKTHFAPRSFLNALEI